ncbi:HAMP domain-containing histidine kinase [bacterium]|nr:HAMP domain-containing histidine kinase [FCB group bacterium]MBL7191544.1 HAMP domain-containing histidine kinase [bacterium]
MTGKKFTEELIAKLEAENARLKEEAALMKRMLLKTYRQPSLGFISVGIAHNLNSPLGGVIGYSQLLQFKAPEAPGVDKIINQARRISELIQRVAKKGETENSHDIEKINLNSLLETEIDYLYFNLFFKHQVLDRQIIYGGISKFLGVYSDFSQCFHQLVSNALHAMYYKEPRKLTIGTALENGHLLLKVTDIGVGIPAENMDKIFLPGFTTKAPLFEAEDVYEPNGGGMGLYICRELLKPYNAELRIESQEGIGTTAIIDIPPETLAREG